MARLDALRAEFGGTPDERETRTQRKVALLHTLGRSRLPSPGALLRFHECLVFLRAYPDDARLLALVERLLEAFAARPDLRRHRQRLVDSGLVGTETHYPFFAATAAWLARQWGAQLRIDWSQVDPRDARLERLLSLVAHFAESPGLDEVDLGTRAWLRRMAGGEEREAELLVRGVDALPADAFVREFLHEQLDLSLVLRPGANARGEPTPNRTIARAPALALAGGRGAPSVHFQTQPLRRERPDLRSALAERPRAVRRAGAAEARALIDLAREAMVARSRDLDVFAYGDPRDVRVVEWGEGLSFAVIGAVPERRLLLESVYGLLTLRNGVPIGYVLFASLFGSTEIAYNVFPTWRGGESGFLYGRVMATARALFGGDSYTIAPYQLGGYGNDEALDSGAWWFYQKLGFRPREPDLLKLMRRELAALQRNPKHRSSRATLARLGSENVFYRQTSRAGATLERAASSAASRAAPEAGLRGDVLGVLDLSEAGLRVTDFLARRFGADRARARRECLAEALPLLKLSARSFRSWTPGERQALERWAPLVLILPGLSSWTAGERRALAALLRAKGGLRESDFVQRFDRHRRLRGAIEALTKT